MLIKVALVPIFALKDVLLLLGTYVTVMSYENGIARGHLISIQPVSIVMKQIRALQPIRLSAYMA